METNPKKDVAGQLPKEVDSDAPLRIDDETEYSMTSITLPSVRVDEGEASPPRPQLTQIRIPSIINGSIQPSIELGIHATKFREYHPEEYQESYNGAIDLDTSSSGHLDGTMDMHFERGISTGLQSVVASEHKIIERREKNRIAAAKSRRKKESQIKQAEHRATMLYQENCMLKQKVKELTVRLEHFQQDPRKMTQIEVEELFGTRVKREESPNLAKLSQELAGPSSSKHQAADHVEKEILKIQNQELKHKLMKSNNDYERLYEKTQEIADRYNALQHDNDEKERLLSRMRDSYVQQLPLFLNQSTNAPRQERREPLTISANGILRGDVIRTTTTMDLTDFEPTRLQPITTSSLLTTPGFTLTNDFEDSMMKIKRVRTNSGCSGTLFETARDTLEGDGKEDVHTIREITLRTPMDAMRYVKPKE